jgi:hypothetical protein
MVDINSVRNTVLAICNKNNYGYISPADFNQYAKLAQLEIFNGYMKLYNYYINKENDHTSGSDFADLAESARESIEDFITAEVLTYSAPSTVGPYSVFNQPSNWYHINQVMYTGGPTEVEVMKSSRREISLLTNSNLTAPTTQNPVYALGDAGAIGISPADIQADVYSVYIRYPADPKWTYSILTNGEPVYNATQLDQQNFEVAAEEEPMLVQKILEMAGLSIREPEVYKTAQSNDNTIQ